MCRVQHSRQMLSAIDRSHACQTGCVEREKYCESIFWGLGKDMNFGTGKVPMLRPEMVPDGPRHSAAIGGRAEWGEALWAGSKQGG